MARISRRELLKLSGGGAVAARAGGIASILALKQAPAYAQATAVHWLRWNDFVPASDEVLRKVIVPECEKALGIKLTIEMINGNDIQARTTSAIQSGTGPDVICALNNWAQLYPESVVANDGKKWIAVPWCVLGAQLAYRKSWLAEIGYDAPKFPQTWEEYREAGKKLKAKGRPMGQAVSHSFGDPPT